MGRPFENEGAASNKVAKLALKGHGAIFERERDSVIL
jgi:hypothetical protein